MERLPRDQPSSAPALPKSPQPTLTTVPVEIRTAIFQECFIGAEISHHYVHHKATDHYAVLLTCRQFYEDGIDTYYDSLTLVVGEKGLEYFSLLQTMVERVQYVRCDEIHQSLTRHMWAGLAQSLKHFLKLKKFDLGSGFRYILHVSKSLTKDVTDEEILKAFGKQDFDLEEIIHVVRGMAALAVTFNVYVVTSREQMVSHSCDH